MKMLNLFHKYFGIFIAYIGFFIFFSGTLAYYKDDITLFMQPEFYNVDYKSDKALTSSVDYLRKNHYKSDIWHITLPTSLTPYALVSYKDDKKILQKRKNRPNIKLNPKTGEKINSRSTYGGNFLSVLHYNLWFIKPQISRALVGYLSLLMLAIIISGVIIHKRLFKDFFKFKKHSIKYDFHIITSVSGLCIFLLLCVSGIYLVEKFMLNSIYTEISMQNKQDLQKDFYEKVKAKREARKNKNIQNSSKTTNLQNNINLENFVPTSLEVQNLVNSKLKNRTLRSISIQKDSPKTAYIQLNFINKKPFTKEGLTFEAELYDIKTGKLIDKTNQKILNTSQKIQQFMKIFHTGNFGGWGVKFIFFMFGILGLLMCLSGALFWQKKINSTKVFHICKALNSTIFLGLFLGFGVYLLSNQLINSQTQLRHEIEVKFFFIALLFSFVISLIFIKKYSYTILSFITSFLFMATGIISFGAGSYHNFNALKITIFNFLLALLFGYLGNKFLKDKK